MDWIVIRNSPLEGRYPIDTDERPLTYGEVGWIKRLTGVLPVELEEAIGKGDAEVIVAFAAIALTRAGKADPLDMRQTFQTLCALPLDGETISMESDPEEVEEDGPPPTSSGESNGSSGAASPENSETLVLPPQLSGTPGWATSESAPQRSGS